MGVETRGPIFSGQADLAAFRMCQEIEEQLGDSGVQMVRSRLAEVLQHPTGRYSSAVTSGPDGGDVAITDSDMVYGPWLEGVGSRNATTRFKGYATFRRVAGELDARAEDLAAPIVDRRIKDMG